MNIFNKVALQGLKKNRTRTAVTIIGVILSASLVTAVVTFGISLLDYAAAGAAQKYGGWHAAFLDVDDAFVKKCADDEETADTVTMKNIGYAKLDGGQNPDKPYLYITGFSQETIEAIPLILLSGRMPENSSEILVPSHVSSNAGVDYAPGDTLSLTIGERTGGGRKLGQNDPYTAGEIFIPTEEKNYTVVGTYGRPRFEGHSAPGYTMVTRADGETKSDDLSVFVTLENPRKVKAFLAKNADGHAYLLNTDVLRFKGIMNGTSDSVFSFLLLSIALIVIVIIMVGSIFLIYNAFSISLNERIQQIGVLSSVGATEKQLRNSVLFEGLCIGAVGIPIGIITGIVGIWIVISVVAPNFSSIMYSGVPLKLHVSLLAILGAAAVSLATILISAYLPAKKAAGIPVMECIRQTNEVKVDARAVKTSKFTERIFGLEGILAQKNFRRNRKRYRSIVLSLILSVVLFISTSSFVIDLKQATAMAVAFTTYDVGLGVDDMSDEEMILLYDRLKNADGVTESSYQADMEYICAVQTGDLTKDYWKVAGEEPPSQMVELAVQFQFLDEETYRGILESAGVAEAEYSGENVKLFANAKLQTGSDDVKGEKKVKDFRDLFKSPSVEAAMIPVTNGEPDREHIQNVEITCIEAVMPDIPPTKTNAAHNAQDIYYFQIIAPWSMKEHFISDAAVPDLWVKGMTFSSENPSQTTAEMEKIIREEGIHTAYTLMNLSNVLEENRNLVFIANVFAYTFIVMISLIAVANVFNTISTNIKLRRRELAMLRSVGMADRDFNKMMRFECAFYGMRALLFGLPTALVISWLIFKGMWGGGADEIVFVMPWASIGISVCSVLLVIFITMMYAVSKIKKENIIDALRDDMT
ncbi:ABC transporter permease [Eisenbergiella sp.]